MADFRQVLKDPEFLKIKDRNEQIAILSSVDPEFGDLDPSEQGPVLESVLSSGPKVDPFTKRTLGRNIPIPGVSTKETPNLQAQQPYAESIRRGVPMAAGLAAGMIPGAGVVAGPLAGVVADKLMGKAYGEDETKPSETAFLTDVAVGMAPAALKGVVGTAAKLIPKPLEQRIASVVRYGFNKGVRPSVSGKANFAQRQAYYEKAQTAVESIVGNKSGLQFVDDAGDTVTGVLPKNLDQFSQSIGQTKRKLFGEYDALRANSETAGIDVDLSAVARELNMFSRNKVVALSGGGGSKHAAGMAELWDGQRLSLTDAQDLLAALNNRLRAFERMPTQDGVSAYAADKLAATNLRKSLDLAVESSDYMPLRRQYGALREIEKEVGNRAMVDARKAPKGLLDFADIATAAEAARALSTLSPGSAAAAGAMKGIKEYYKHLNNPNTHIKAMFKEADKLIGKRSTVPKP